MNNKPVVSASDQTVMIGDSIDVSSFLNVTDPEGDAITKYRVAHTSQGGYFTLNGVELAANVIHEIDAADYANLAYHAGGSVANEEVKIWAFDGTDWSDAADVHMYSYQANSAPPVVDVPNQYILQNEWVNLADIANIYDPDGLPIQWIGIKDRIAFGGTGSLIYNGAFHTQGEFLWVRPEDLENVYYAAGLPNYTEFLDIWAYDGLDWSRGYSWMGVKANKNIPTLQPRSFEVPSGVMRDPSSFVDYYDEDGNTAKQFMVYDSNLASNSGYFMLDGVRLDAQVWHTMTAKQFDRLQFYAASTNISEEFKFRASDGLYTSAPSSIWFTTLPKPELTSGDHVMDSQLKNYSFANYFQQVDPGPDLTTMQVYVVNYDPLGARVFSGGSPLQGGQVHTMSVSQFNNLVLRTGTYEQRSYNQFQVRGFNGNFWTGWETIEVRTEPEINRALYFGSAFPSQNWTQFLDDQPVAVTYSFFQQHPGGNYATGSADADEFSKLTSNQRNAVRMAFNQISSFTNLQFVEVPDAAPNEYGGIGGIMRFGNYTDPDDTAAAFAFPPVDPENPDTPQGGDVWFNLAFLNPFNFVPNSFEFMTVLHEIGHAIGLKHTFDDSSTLPGITENRDYSVMSYTGGSNFLEPRTFQLYDIEALQGLYGTNNSDRGGDDTYTVTNLLGGSTNAVATIWDSGGNDTLNTSGTNIDSQVDIRNGGKSSVGNGNNNVTIAFSAMIENAITGNGNDVLQGNYGDNQLSGNLGRDLLIGDIGNDYLMGGGDSDTYQFKVGDGIDVINEQGLAGRDRIRYSSHPWLDNLASDFTFRRENNDLVINLTLNNGDNQGTITIENQAWGGYRIESLEFGTTKIDLVNLFSQLGAYTDQSFQVTGATSAFGNLVSPV